MDPLSDNVFEQTQDEITVMKLHDFGPFVYSCIMQATLDDFCIVLSLVLLDFFKNRIYPNQANKAVKS